MIAAGSLAVTVGIAALAVGALPAAWHTALVLAPIFLMVGFAQAGVRLGRKTYLVDAAPESNRPLYVALINTIIGALTLASGVLGVVAEISSLTALLAVFILMTALGVLAAWRMPEAEQMIAA
jgi:hypothetical protein